MDRERTLTPLLASLATACLCLAAFSASASASPVVAGDDGQALPRSADEERELRAYETETLGDAHARDHAIQRRALRRKMRKWRRLSPAQRRRRLAASNRRDAAIAKKTKKKTGPATRVGRWTTSSFPIPNYAIHSAVLPTGKVLFWGYPPLADGQRANVGLATLWNPRRGTGAGAFKDAGLPLIDVDGNGTVEPAPIYCSGQSFLATGELLLAGGNLIWPSASPVDPYTDAAGAKFAFTFDPFTEKWVRQPDMNHGRWYPSQVELADGRTLVLGGYDETPPGANVNTDLEIFTPGPSALGVGSFGRLPSGDRLVSGYPHLFTLPNGRVLLAGPGTPAESALLNTDTFTWDQLPGFSRQRDKGTAALLPGDPNGSFTAMQMGGFDLTKPADADGVYPAVATTESIDAAQPAPGWQPQSPMHVARGNHNNVQLPDGSMVTIGGGRGYSDSLGGYVTYPDGRARQVELWDRRTKTWQLGPAQLEDRTYHSTAVLLPDGRVMSAGDDFHPSVNGNFSTSDSAEIYSPPYLFRRGKRPKVKRVPRTVVWGKKFKIETRSRSLRRAVLMAPDATTHGVDMQQRHVELRIKDRDPGEGLTVKAPPGAAVAPPGYYMLFVLNKRGEPSVAKWVKLAATTGASTKKNRRKQRR